MNSELDLRRDGGALIVTLRGELDAADVRSIGHRLTREARKVLDGLIVDLSELSYLDSPGVGLLFSIAEAERARGRVMRIVVPPGAATRRVLQICSIDDVAELHAAVDLALADLRRQRG